MQPATTAPADPGHGFSAKTRRQPCAGSLQFPQVIRGGGQPSQPRLHLRPGSPQR